MSGAAFHDQLKLHGIDLGPRFRAVERLWAGDREALGEIRLPDSRRPNRVFRMHPVLLDACFQVVGAAWEHRWNGRLASGRHRAHDVAGIPRPSALVSVACVKPGPFRRRRPWPIFGFSRRMEA